MNLDQDPKSSPLKGLAQRKLVQWTLAYLAGAWVLFEVADAVGGRWNLPDVFFQGLFIVLVIGALLTALLAWYHGEQGRQSVSGPELLFLALILAIGGFTLSRLDGSIDDADASVPGAFASAPAAFSSSDDPAIAVLPFTITGGEETDQFADGMHEEVLHALAQVSGLIVKSRQSVLQYRGSTKPIREIAEELRADALVGGGIRVAGDRIRVTVHLIDARADAHIWSDTFDRSLSAPELFTIQEEVARKVARALEVTLTWDDSLRLTHRATQSLDARTVYLQALAAQRVSDTETRRLLHLAIAMDSTYDRPWGLLAELVGAETATTNDLTLADSAVALAEKALALDPTRSSGDAYNAVGFVRMAQGRVADARTAFAEGMRNAPNDPALANNLGVIYAATGMFPEAIAAYRRGIEISPGHIGNRTNLAQIYETLGLREGRAERLLLEAQTLQPAHEMVISASAQMLATQGDPDSALALFVEWEAQSPVALREEQLRAGAVIATWVGDFARARDYASEALELDPDVLPLFGGHMAHVTLGFTLAMEGNLTAAVGHLDEASRLLEPLVSGGSEFPSLYMELAAIEAIRGNVEAAMAWFRRAHELGFRSPNEIDLDPVYDPLRGRPAFERIMVGMRAQVAEMRDVVLATESELH